MLRDLFNKFMIWLNEKTNKYVYDHIYIPKHADKDFWGDDL